MKPAQIEAAYEFLRLCKPFTGWNLPTSDNINFRVTRSNMVYGDYEPDPHTIRASLIKCRTSLDLIQTVAHEMVHLALEIKGDPLHPDHLGAFNRYAQKVCDEFQWDWKEF